MADPFVAEIRIFPFNFAPKGWAFCNGQLMPISQNTALFSLLGTNYGGNGTTNFALPNFQGVAPMQHGQGAGLSLRDLGEVGGVETITLLATNMPMHNHTAKGVSIGNASEPSSLVTWADLSGRPAPHFYNDTIGGAVNMNVAGLSLNGGGLPHNNLMPYLTLNFCIALQGAFPPRW